MRSMPYPSALCQYYILDLLHAAGCHMREFARSRHGDCSSGRVMMGFPSPLDRDLGRATGRSGMAQTIGWPALAALVLGYALGSIPFGLLLTRLAGTQDIRAIGSGSIGATNVLRTGRKGLAAATLIADLLKGTVAVLIAAWLWGRDAGMIAGFGAFVGHLFPVWLRF